MICQNKSMIAPFFCLQQYNCSLALNYITQMCDSNLIIWAWVRAYLSEVCSDNKKVQVTLYLCHICVTCVSYGLLVAVSLCHLFCIFYNMCLVTLAATHTVNPVTFRSGG